MTIISRFFVLFTLAVACGCSQPQPEHSTPTDPPAVAITPTPVDSDPKEVKSDPLPTTTEFPFTSDLTGQALAEVSEPDLSPSFRVEQFGKAPRPRLVPKLILEPNTISRATYIPPPIPSPKRIGGVKFPNPPEKLPLTIGADDIPAKPVLPVVATKTVRARDVNLPPPAPTLGRKMSDRVPFDDPTSDLGNTVIVSESVKVPLAPSSFLKRKYVEKRK